MPITYEIEGIAGVVRITWVGMVPIGDWAKLMDQIRADPRYRRGYVFLSDRRAVTTAPTVTEIKISVDYFTRHRTELGQTTWAILIAPTLVDFGMMRMGETLASDLIVMRYFETEPEAEVWLQEVRRAPGLQS